MDAIRQDVQEAETDYCRRFQNKANECVGVYTDKDLIIGLIRGSVPYMKPLVSVATFGCDHTATLFDYVNFA